MKLANRDTEESIEFTWNSTQDLILAAKRISDPTTHITDRSLQLEGLFDNEKALEEISTQLDSLVEKGYVTGSICTKPRTDPSARCIHLWISEVGNTLVLL